MLSLENKKILVTGASSGIGQSSAKLIAEAGGNAVLISRREELLAEVTAALPGAGHNFFAVDVTDDEMITQVIKKSVLESGPFDGFVHSAGMELTAPLKILNKNSFEKALMLNAFAAFQIAKILIQKGNFNSTGGSFVFIGSVMANLGQPAKIGYCASKGALTAGAKAMALELSNKKIRVNTIQPGMVESEMSLELLSNLGEDNIKKIREMHPLGIGRVEDVANTVAFLLSDLSKWITGSSVFVDGGYSAH